MHTLRIVLGLGAGVSVWAAPAAAQAGPASTATAVREFALDAGHSEIALEIPFLYGKVRGRFPDVRGTILLGDGPAGTVPAASVVAVVIGAASISTGAAHRDEHLRSDDFFDVARYPTITFTGRVLPPSAGQPRLTGPLTLHGVTRDITFPFTMSLPPTDDPHGMTVVSFEARLTLARQDFGILGGDTHNSWFDQVRSATMGDSVSIVLEVHGWAPDAQHPDASLGQALRRLDSLGVRRILDRLRALRRADAAAFAAGAYGFDQLGRALLARGRSSDGTAVLALVAELLPGSANALVSAGAAYESTGDTSQALAAYRRALAIDSLNTRAIARLLGLTRGPPSRR